nr:hypothetical protein [Tanacetum cinerariifolium]
VALQALPSPDYIPGPEEPEQAPPSPDYIPGPEHADDKIVAEDQPYAEDALPNAQSPEYVPESDFEANPEDDDDEDPEEDPVDYLADGGDDDDDEEGSSEHDEDDDMDIEADEEEEEEHPAPADSVVVVSTIPFPPLPPILSPPSPVLSPAPPPSPIRSLGYRAAMIRLRDEAASTSSPPLQLPSASRREDRPEGTPVSTNTELGGYMREFETRVRHDTNEIYMRLDDEQTERQLLAGRLNMLFKDRRAHAYTCHLMETEARMSREAWVRSTDASDLVRDHGRSTEIIELRTALQGQVTALQGQVTALQAQVTALQGQQGLAGGPTQPELP